jgi:hypothetical protein
MKDYILVQHATEEKLIEAVNAKFKEGYIALGGISVIMSRTTYFAVLTQAMAKVSKPAKALIL